jgi:hypothetical protein
MESSRIAPVPVIAALAAAVGVAALGLQEFAFSDYEAEALPAVERLVSGDVAGFLSRLPAYGGALLLEAPGALFGSLLGGDQALWTWRAQAVVGLLLLAVLGALFGSMLAARLGGASGTVAGAVAAGLIAGSPFAVRAETVGHPEDLLVVGLLLAGCLAATRERLGSAGALVGLAAVAKPWALIGVPVVLVAAQTRTEFVRTFVLMCVAGAVLAAPMVVADAIGIGPHRLGTSSGAIFKPAQIFWFFGADNPVDHATRAAGGRGFDAAMAPYADRLPPSWASAWSHPLILLLAPAAAAVYRQHRVPGRQRDDDLMLLLAALLWWRCLLDTWNADYYALGGLTCLAAWEVMRGRIPVVAIGLTVIAWVTFRGAGAYWATSPDVHTAVYLAWSIPAGSLLLWRAVSPGSARTARSGLARKLRRTADSSGSGVAAEPTRA